MADSEEIMEMETSEVNKDVATSSNSETPVEEGQSENKTSENATALEDKPKITITVKTPMDKKDITVSADACTNQLKEVAARAFEVLSDRLCFIYSGKVLQDSDLLAALGIVDGSTVHLVIKSAVAQKEPQQNASADETSSDKLPFSPMQFAHIGTEPLNYAQLQQQMQRQMLSNPDTIRQMVENPLVQQLMANPSVITELISSNPQTKDWLKRNPELAEMLNDKEIMQQTLEISNNPEMLNELIAAQGKGKFTHNATSGANKFGGNAMPELQTMWQHLAQKPQILQHMFDSPYMKSYLEGVTANPQITQQMIANQQLFANNPALQQQMQHMMPHYLQQLQNPTMKAMMTNQKAMQSLIKIQSGLDMLNAEAPGFIGSFGFPHLSQPPSLSTFAPSATDASGSALSDASAGSTDAASTVLSQMISQMASGQLNQAPEERFKDQLEQLTTMGFTDYQTNLKVLIGAFGDLGAAVEHLNRH